MEEILTILLSKKFSGINFEFDCCLNDAWVVLEHFLVSLFEMVLLDVVADVMESGGTYVAACSFESMCQILILIIILCLNCRYYFFHSFL